MVNDDIEQFKSERDKALINLDMDYARRILPKASCDEVRLIALHKARYECRSIPKEFRHASANWLRLRKFKRLGGLELLPEGELPE